ncbi:MAG: hypothetical protein COB24_11865 [Hyphomicrobiales bacterium]|nr:MAG: hypothetical protein COB24_11865 [Hyphomicrobiales bacterium]
MGVKKIKNPSEGKLYNRHLADFMENPRKIGNFRAKGAALFSAGALIQSSERIVEYLTECQAEFLASIKERR